jgi:hypothetical protein
MFDTRLILTLRALIAAFAAMLSLAATPSQAGPFDSWAAIVVAGDYRAHSGAPSEVFDNARRDLVKALTQIGFSPANIQQYSTRPQNDPDTHPSLTDAQAIHDKFKLLAQKAPAGCFVYMTSHGAPLGIMLGEDLVPLRAVGDIVDDACSNRPTVVIISACFSGMFIPVLLNQNRMILTAARPEPHLVSDAARRCSTPSSINAFSNPCRWCRISGASGQDQRVRRRAGRGRKGDTAIRATGPTSALRLHRF